jgi:hypothetical protein
MKGFFVDNDMPGDLLPPSPDPKGSRVRMVEKRRTCRRASSHLSSLEEKIHALSDRCQGPFISYLREFLIICG